MEPGYAAICLNMDSVGQALGWPIDHRDAVYHQVLDRFLTLAQRFDFKYTVQVVGRDLLVREHFDQIRRLSEAGHEIGNHTWSYQPALGEIGAWWLESEILDTHSKIAECIGRVPKGFATPCWGYSPRIVKALARLGYRYDASLLPCARCLPPNLSSLFRTIHASDLLCAEDFQRGPRRAGAPSKQALEQQQMLSEALWIICDSGRRMVTMNEMSERVRAEMHREPEILVA